MNRPEAVLALEMTILCHASAWGSTCGSTGQQSRGGSNGETHPVHYGGANKKAEWRLTVRRSVWRKHITLPKTAGSEKPVPASLRVLLDELREAEGNPESGPILRGQFGAPLDLNTLVKREIIPALRRCVICSQPQDPRRKDYGHEFKLDTSLPTWRGLYAFRRGIATEVTAATKDVLAAKGLLRHSSISTTMAHYVKDVPEATRRGMEQIEVLCSKREVDAPEETKPN